MANKLTGLSKHTVIVADSGDIEALRHLQAEDCTTNPSLILKAATRQEYAKLVREAAEWARGAESDSARRIEFAIDKVAVNFGAELAHIVPGYISTEVDARLSFDADATIERAERIISLYRDAGVDVSRILIKVAATWEGIRAAAELTRRGYKCNLTLIFSLAQAVACADAGVFLISPFVGRIYDWYAARGDIGGTAKDDPGVRSVHEIYRYYKTFGYETIVMGASFRSTEQLLAIAGCDRLTISPALLEKLQAEEGDVPRVLDPAVKDSSLARLNLDEATFRWLLNEDAMATEKLAEGIRLFARDTEKLADLIQAEMNK